jgi:hypothetical protein
MSAKGRAAGVVEHLATAQESKRTQILGPQHLDRKEFDTLRTRFAHRGYTLQRVYRAGDGHPTYHASRTAQTHIFSHPHDVGAFLAVVEGSAV